MLEANRQALVRRTIKHDADHQTAAAHLHKARNVLEGLAEPFLQILAHLGGVFHQMFVLHDRDDGRGRAHRQRIAAEGRAVVARRKDAVGLFAAHESADGNAAAQSLREGHHIGLDARVLEGEPLARAAHAALHFVEHHEPVVTIAQFANAAHRLVRERDDAAFALHRFEHHGADTRRGLSQALDHLEIAGGHADEVGHIGLEVTAHVGVARGRERGDRAAVEGVFEHDHLGLEKSLGVAVLTGQFEGRFVGFQTRVAKEAPAQAALFADLGRDLFLQIDAEVVRDVNDFGDLLLQGRHQARMVVPDGVHGDAGKTVKVGIAFGIGEPHPLSLFKADGERRKNRQQVRLCHFFTNLSRHKREVKGSGKNRFFFQGSEKLPYFMLFCAFV